GNVGSSKITGAPDPYMKPPKAYLDMLDRAARLPPLPEMMPEPDPLSSARDKQKLLKVKMEKDLESLWNNYKNNERKRKMQSGEECSQDAAMPNVSMSCFISDTSLRPACEHMCLCSRCDNKPQECPYCLAFDGSS
ncbi:hypothetical protein Tco_1498766, partial [Tanacetum coccineum]